MAHQWCERRFEGDSAVVPVDDAIGRHRRLPGAFDAGVVKSPDDFKPVAKLKKVTVKKGKGFKSQTIPVKVK